MKPRLSPYLNFDGTCREAMNFYQSILGGELYFQTVGESPIADQVPASMKDAILHSTLNTGALEIMASDMNPTKLIDGNGTSMCLVFKDEAETKDCYEKLSEGGVKTQPIHEMFFGLIGALTDRFGKNWIVECDKVLA